MVRGTSTLGRRRLPTYDGVMRSYAQSLQRPALDTIDALGDCNHVRDTADRSTIVCAQE